MELAQELRGPPALYPSQLPFHCMPSCSEFVVSHLMVGVPWPCRHFLAFLSITLQFVTERRRVRFRVILSADARLHLRQIIRLRMPLAPQPKKRPWESRKPLLGCPVENIASSARQLSPVVPRKLASGHPPDVLLRVATFGRRREKISDCPHRWSCRQLCA